MDGKRHMWFRVSGVKLLVAVCLLFSASVSNASDWYVGADLGNRFIYSDGNYESNHLRLKGSYRLYRPFFLEVQASTKGQGDSDNGPEGRREWSSSEIFGIFIKPLVTFHRDRAGVYGLIGGTWMKTTYRFPDLGVEDKENFWSFAGGVGMQFNVARGFGFSIDVLWTTGEANYPHIVRHTTSAVPVNTATVSAGINYRF